MSRMSSSERRQQIVDAVLELLAELPLEELTTRHIARKVGLTQPGLFRHFRSREAMLEAAVAHVRGRLSAAAEELLQASDEDRVYRMVQVLGAQVQATPGLLRLLLHSVHRPHRSPHASLAALIDTQIALVGELLRQEGIDPSTRRRAARALVAIIQGTMLQWHLTGRTGDLLGELAWTTGLWRAGLASQSGQADPLPASPTRCLISLDVRPILAGGSDPLEQILACLEDLEPDGLLRITAPFRPGPLLVLLKGEGLGVHCVEDSGTWTVWVRGTEAPELQDLRDLPAPMPLERVLQSTTCNRVTLVHLPRLPRLLLPHLTERDLSFTVLELDDGTALLHIRGTR